MISTEINILDYIEISEDDTDNIINVAKADCLEKIMDVANIPIITDLNLEFSFDFICKTTIKIKNKNE